MSIPIVRSAVPSADSSHRPRRRAMCISEPGFRTIHGHSRRSNSARRSTIGDAGADERDASAESGAPSRASISTRWISPMTSIRKSTWTQPRVPLSSLTPWRLSRRTARTSFPFPAGDYTLAISCDAVDNDPEFDDGILVPSPDEEYVEVSTSPGERWACKPPFPSRGVSSSSRNPNPNRRPDERAKRAPVHPTGHCTTAHWPASTVSSRRLASM